MNETNKDIKRYLRKVKGWIPCAGKTKKQIMDQICASVQEYLKQKPEASFSDLCARFGSPQDIAAAYIDNTETAEILKNLRIRRKIVTVAVAAALAVFLYWAISVTIVVIQHKSSCGFMGIEYVEDFGESVEE